MIIGLIGLNTAVSAEDISYWVNTGYNSNLTRLTHTCDDESDSACHLMTSIAATSKSNSGLYGGVSAEYHISPNTSVGAHVSFTGNTSRFGIANTLNPTQIGNDGYSEDFIVQQSTSPTIGVFSAYQFKDTSFSLGLDLDRIYLTEAFSFASQYYSARYFDNIVIYNPKIVIETATQLSKYKVSLSAYWGPSSTIIQDEAGPVPTNISIGESGIKVTISHSLMPLLQSL
jgi:hypothetical protein